mmetsp:Transcript_40155/g.61324  ORF Transcript_40155/g.61324 Transcript_40155/m.61324 type:complete len:188 (+) Transcript_40155:220-783(+)|eukprot:CAMPEP_0170507596 /NCGR_PEP_ID=MMETSP0208-20121228/59371_1 /TAXON_ID=197538 /ORGANISM="Strombidium inclinatum, Strain S3" /LENGTH=187 /DNA_ID=CAMNT_0010789885 /DNA_START=204 /DNA_END=767 /DNA_ORIENTATION=-
MKHGYELLDKRTYKKQLHNTQKKRIAKMVAKDPLSDEQVIDSAKMSQIMLLTQIIRVIHLIVNITFLSYFTGLAWYIISEATKSSGIDKDEHFVDGFEGKPVEETTVALVYFTFTTLTTVGLGDLHPKNNTERIMCSFTMLFGVMCTSVLMDNFSKMLNELKNFNRNYDESAAFNKFINTLKHFNAD